MEDKPEEPEEHMTDSEILDWLEANACPIEKFLFGKWIHRLGRRPPLYKRRQYDSLREAVLAAVQAQKEKKA